MGEIHAYSRRRGRFGRDDTPALAARTLRDAEISATQIKCAAPSHELTTSIPREDAGCKATSRFARSRILAGWQAASTDQTAKVGEADALKG